MKSEFKSEAVKKLIQKHLKKYIYDAVLFNNSNLNIINSNIVNQNKLTLNKLEEFQFDENYIAYCFPYESIYSFIINNIFCVIDHLVGVQTKLRLKDIVINLNIDSLKYSMDIKGISIQTEVFSNEIQDWTKINDFKYEESRNDMRDLTPEVKELLDNIKNNI